MSEENRPRRRRAYPNYRIPKIDISIPNTGGDLRALTAGLNKRFEGLDQMITRLRRSLAFDLDPIRQTLQALQKDLAPFLEELNRHSAARATLREAGLLPHATTPWEAFSEETSGDFPDICRAHYRDNWGEVERQITAELADYMVSSSARLSLEDALACHRAGLYRSAVLTLLPSVEMEFRRTFEISPGDPAASLIELRGTIKMAPAQYITSHVAPFDLFRILDTHLYATVKTPEALRRFEGDPIPNRHAAIHGLIEYADELHSLNTIIMADYVFFLISQLARNAEDDES